MLDLQVSNLSYTYLFNFISFIILSFLFCWLFVFLKKRRNNRYKILKYIYEEALKRGNPSEAFEAGKKYYTALRGGKFLLCDERTIKKDIAKMDKARALTL